MIKRPLTFAAIAALIVLCAASSARAQTKGWPRATGGRIQAAPLLVDLDSDGKLEILVPSFDDKLHIYNHDGTTFDPGASPWPLTLGFGAGTMASVAVGDVDGDGSPEIVVAGDDAIHVDATIKVYETDATLVDSILLNANASAKATPCLIDCYRFDGTRPLQLGRRLRRFHRRFQGFRL